MTQEISYKDTLNLPQTSFPMKAALAQREPEMIKSWQDENLYARIKEQFSKRPTYILHDGPPYANGNIHIGHALNKILKDIIVKYKTLRGFNALYVPGWDCHGLPIEHQCLKNMGKRKEEVERVPFRKQAREYAEKYVGIQREEFKRLGVFGEWENPYLTMNYEYQASIADAFLRIEKEGYIEQRLKPVPWCWDCETALADAELEYADKVSDSVYVTFKLDLASFPQAKPGEQLEIFQKMMDEKRDVFFLVWTTTPWTLPANVGLAIHPDLSYCVLDYQNKIYICAERLSDSLIEKFHWSGVSKKGVLEGSRLLRLSAFHPFLERRSQVIDADYVSAEDGTGIVHIAPGHGEDDYKYGYIMYQLPILSPVDAKARFTQDYPASQGVHVFKANEQIIELLRSKDALLLTEKHSHSYPHCWRCRKPIIFRATPQWFMKIDENHLRDKMGDAIQKDIQFTPDWGKNRIGSMVQGRPDWCLSRQRYWGVPIPMVHCADCQNSFPADRPKVNEIFQKEGADAWFLREAKDFLPDQFKCGKCGGHHFKKDEDIIDVWFDSGVSHQAVLRKCEGLTYPADLYLEGSDQHRGWFQSSLTTAMALEGKPPFNGVLTHGFVMDGEGKKMSKSAGNVVAPQDVMKEFGADILRLWVSSCDYEYDVRLSKDILKQLADSYRKIRNTFRYMLGNLADFQPTAHGVTPQQLHGQDQWAIAATNNLLMGLSQKYDRYEFHQIYQQVHNFCVLQLSGYYFDSLKDILYTCAKNSQARRSAQTVLYYMLTRLVKALAPILPFTMDEVWRAIPLQGEAPSVHLTEWKDDFWKIQESSSLLWNDVRALRDVVMPHLEKKREEKVIGANLDAKVLLNIRDPEMKAKFETVLKELPRAFIVSQVAWTDEEQGELGRFASLQFNREMDVRILIQKADGNKCVRCWNYSPQVGMHAKHPGLCPKCLEAVQEAGA